MALFKSREFKELEAEVEELREENVRLTLKNCELDLKLFEVYGRELADKISDELSLSAEQRSHLQLVFTVERMRLAGIPEDKIIHDLDEATKFFTE